MAKLGEITTGESAVAFTSSDHPLSDRNYTALHSTFATSSYVLQGATVVLDFASAQAQCDEAGIRQIASWETPRASQGPMGASGTRADFT